MKILRTLALAAGLAVLAAAMSAAQARPGVSVRLPFTSVHGWIVVKASLAENEGNFILDTGSELTLADRAFLGLKPEGKAYDVTADPRQRKTHMVELGPVCLGSFCMERATIGSAEFAELSKRAGMRIDGMLGADLLRQFDTVTIDYKNSVVTLSKGAN